MPVEPFLFSLPSELDSQDAWVGVKGGGLEQTTYVRVKFTGTRAHIVGLYIDDGQPVTSTTLRFRIGELAQSLSEYLAYVSDNTSLGFDLSQLAAEVEESGQLFMGIRPPLPADEERREWHTWTTPPAFVEGIRRWMDELTTKEPDAAAVDSIAQRGRGASPPTDAELRAFASIYDEERRAGRRGAKQRTATRVGMDRSTVYKWIARCQAAGIEQDEGTTL